MLNRRHFLQRSGLAGAGLYTLSHSSFGFPVIEEDPLLPKNLDKAWVQSLFQRTNATTYRKSRSELSFIGMPVGGIMCGMVYLGGDGRLWLWDVFNKNQSGVIYKNIPWHEKIQFTFDYLRPFDGANYVQPVKDVRPLSQGLALKFNYDGKSIVRKLDESSWDEIEFEATYPVATIRYISKDLPFEVSLQAYSPFIPLNPEDSALPATILELNVVNKSGRDATITFAGWLENKTALYSANDAEYFRVNEPLVSPGMSAVIEKAGSHNWADETFVNAPDYGDFCIALLGDGGINTDASQNDESIFTDRRDRIRKDITEKLTASVSKEMKVASGKSVRFNSVIAWYFPHLTLEKLKAEGGRHYAKGFKSSADVAKYISENFNRLSEATHLWSRTWYSDSTLPHWFLERTFLNISTLATTTCHWFESGRFYAWEGIGSCPGTCNHVWQYAQAVARIFPSLESDTRERVDLGIALHEDGHIGFRGEYDTQPAIDGQAGRILGVYREHQMSNDNEFLKRNWSKTKRAIEFLLKQDTNDDGMTDTTLENTLDAKWPGEISWIVGLSLAAVKASQKMAEEMGDKDLEVRCKAYFEKGKANMESQLFNGEYFIHRPDPVKGRTVIGSFNTCHIDQVYGQSWAFQAGLERVINKEKSLSALRALWKYNFTTDVGPYLKNHHGGRPYALPGEGGMIMNTNPKNEETPYGVKDAWQVTYFHECMSGFEHQVASHMMAEGMVEESLILTRSIHDRYHAAKRNPFNEVECSDHYARAMASYGTFITACGFTYHGPRKEIGFAPKLFAEGRKFQSAFVTAEGWGTYSQSGTKQMNCTLEVKSGRLTIQTITLEKEGNVSKAQVKWSDRNVPSAVSQNGKQVIIRFTEPVTIETNQSLIITV